jgi:hypothetical protein
MVQIRTCESVLIGKRRVNVMTVEVYSLEINNTPVLKVEAFQPEWLPFRPKINPRWLRSALNLALANYFAEDRVVKA